MKRRPQQIPAKGGDEDGVFCRYRHAAALFYNNTGLVKRQQRCYNKRVRKLVKEELKHEQGGQA